MRYFFCSALSRIRTKYQNLQESDGKSFYEIGIRKKKNKQTNKQNKHTTEKIFHINFF